MKDTSPVLHRQQQNKRYSVPAYLTATSPSSNPNHHWSITDMTIASNDSNSSDCANEATLSGHHRNRSASLPFLTLNDLQPYQQPPVLKIVVLGCADVGKTSLIMQFVSGAAGDMSDYESMLSGEF